MAPSTAWLRSPEIGNSGLVADVLHRVSAPAVKLLTDAQRAFLENPYVGIVTDLRPDGPPHSTVVWVDFDDDGISFNTARPRAKPRDLEPNPLVALSVVGHAGLLWIALALVLARPAGKPVLFTTAVTAASNPAAVAAAIAAL